MSNRQGQAPSNRGRGSRHAPVSNRRRSREVAASATPRNVSRRTNQVTPGSRCTRQNPSNALTAATPSLRSRRSITPATDRSTRLASIRISDATSSTTLRQTRSRSITPASATPVSSIRDSARYRSLSHGRQQGRTYSQPTFNRLTPTVHEPEDLPAPTPEATITLPTPPVLSNPTPHRHCYCNIDCPQCRTAESCSKHDGLYCSGPCSRWFHIKCIGWKAQSLASDQNVTSIEPPWNSDTSIYLNSNTQQSQPWYCTKCWEICKRAHSRIHLSDTTYQCCPPLPPTSVLKLDSRTFHFS